MTEDQLDQQLREAAPYIDDAGFTAMVVAKLPSVRPAQSLSRRGMILVAVTALGSMIAYLLSGRGRFVDEVVIWLANFPVWLLLIFAFGIGLVAGACAVIAAIRKTPEAKNLGRLQS